MTLRRNGRGTVSRIFMQTLDFPSLRFLKREAKKRGIKVQQLIRAVICPEWLSWKTQKLKGAKKTRKNAKGKRKSNLHSR